MGKRTKPARPASRTREAPKPDVNGFMSESVAALISRAVRKGYLISVDDRTKLAVCQSRDLSEIGRNMRTHRDLVWLRDKTGFKFGWMQVDSWTGEILEYSRKDKRTIELISSEFLGRMHDH
jgi:hypothetical protein